MLVGRTAVGHCLLARSPSTAAGQTACIDMQAPASQTETSLEERAARRWIWLVVDRRIDVNEAHVRELSIASNLATADISS